MARRFAASESIESYVWSNSRESDVAARLRDWASRPGPDGTPIAERPDVARALAQIGAYARINELLNWQVASTGEAISMADAAATKVFSTERIQTIMRLADDILGRYGDYTDPETAALVDWLDVQAKRNVVITFGGGVNEEQGWGRADEGHLLQGELAAYAVEPQWFGLGDCDLGTHVARSLWLGQGASLSEVTARLAARWGLPESGFTLRPMTDTPVETHVVIPDDDGTGSRAVHFQEWWVRLRAAVAAQRFVVVGMDRATPAPGVLEAIRTADVVLLPPSNPVVSIGVILGVPGVRDALRGTPAPVVGVSAGSGIRRRARGSAGS